MDIVEVVYVLEVGILFSALVFWPEKKKEKPKVVRRTTKKSNVRVQNKRS
jgi:hypothetical protein